MLTVKCINRFRDRNNNITGYRLQDQFGSIKDVKPKQLKMAINQGNIHVVNLELTRDNKLIHKETPIQTDKKSSYAAFQAFVAKQNLVGKIFDFEIDKGSGDICIIKYHDSPDRKEVVIPDFVDRFLTHEDEDESTIYGVFSECRYVEKIIMHSNIKGSLDYLFFDFRGNKLDLSDFDTSSVISMEAMFIACRARSINFGDKFNTSRVEDMKEMFAESYVQSLNLGPKFDTSNVGSMHEMFSGCKAKIINLGDKFSTDSIYDTQMMFSGDYRIIVGKHVTEQTIEDLQEEAYSDIIVR